MKVYHVKKGDSVTFNCKHSANVIINQLDGLLIVSDNNTDRILPIEDPSIVNLANLLLHTLKTIEE